MGRSRTLSGNEVRAILESCGFAVHGQRGSHIKLRRIGPGGAKQTLIVPAHGTRAPTL